MKVALTGASGFVGRHVLKNLISRRLDTVASMKDGDHLSIDKGEVEVVELDITRPGVNPYDRLGKPDLLIHLAWDGLPNYKSLRHFEKELPSQYFFLKRMIEKGLKRLIITGTCFEYGMQSGALSETAEPRPITPYGYAKNALREQLEFLQTKIPFELTWGRLFYLHGAGQSETSLFSQLQASVSRKESTFNMSGGEQLRDYLSISEAAATIVDLAVLERDVGIVNICSGNPISVRRLVEQWILKNDWSIQLNLGYYPYPDYEPMAFWGDRGRLNSLLNVEGSPSE